MCRCHRAARVTTSRRKKDKDTSDDGGRYFVVHLRTSRENCMRLLTLKASYFIKKRWEHENQSNGTTLAEKSNVLVYNRVWNQLER